MTAAKTVQVPRLLSMGQVADHLAVSQKTVRRLIADGQLPSHRVRGQVRVSECDLAAYVAQSRVYPGATWP
jgi:excisionase family DNA binding protein